MKILIVNGIPRSGKTSFEQFAFEKRGMVYPMSTVDFVKRVAVFAGWSGEKDEKGRRFLSDLKDAMTLYKDIPHQHIIEEMNQRLDMYAAGEISTDNIIFLVDSREPEDIARWENEYGARSLLISRPGLKQVKSNHADFNVSQHQYNYHLLNNGTEEEWRIASIGFIDKIRSEDWSSDGPGLRIWDK